MRAKAAPTVALVVLISCTSLGTGKALADEPPPGDRETYGQAMTIVGPAEQRARIRAQLDALKALPTGARLLAAIEAASRDGRAVTIEYIEGWAATGADAAKAAPARHELENDTVTILEPGAGTSAVIVYDPQKEGADCISREIILGHELIHALHALQGRSLTRVPWVEPNGNATTYEERVTSGLGGIADPDGITENALRAEQGLPLRTSYDEACGTPEPSGPRLGIADRLRLGEPARPSGAKKEPAGPVEGAPVVAAGSAGSRASALAALLNTPWSF